MDTNERDEILTAIHEISLIIHQITVNTSGIVLEDNKRRIKVHLLTIEAVVMRDT